MRESIADDIGAGAAAQDALGFPTFEQDSWRRSIANAWAPWRRRPLGVIGAIVIFAVILLAFLAPVGAPYDHTECVGGRVDAPNSKNLLGTNLLGQDVLSRSIYGAQVSMGIALSATLIGVGLGTVLGVVSAYYGGWTDLIVQRLMEVLA